MKKLSHILQDEEIDLTLFRVYVKEHLFNDLLPHCTILKDNQYDLKNASNICLVHQVDFYLINTVSYIKYVYEDMLNDLIGIINEDSDDVYIIKNLTISYDGWYSSVDIEITTVKPNLAYIRYKKIKQLKDENV